jgi:hypothetical protein
MTWNWSGIWALLREYLDSQVRPKPEPPKPEPPDPSPVPPSSPPPDPTPTQVTVWDGALIGQWMDEKGWYGNGTEQWYALFSTYGEHEWGAVGDAPTAVNLWNHREDIRQWFSDRVAEVGKQMLANPAMTATLIINDANDLGGYFMARPIRRQLEDMGIDGGRMINGDVY